MKFLKYSQTAAPYRLCLLWIVLGISSVSWPLTFKFPPLSWQDAAMELWYRCGCKEGWITLYCVECSASGSATISPMLEVHCTYWGHQVCLTQILDCMCKSHALGRKNFLPAIGQTIPLDEYAWFHRLVGANIHSPSSQLEMHVCQGCACVYMACTTIPRQGRPSVLWRCWWHTLSIVLACTNTQYGHVRRKWYALKWYRKYASLWRRIAICVSH